MSNIIQKILNKEVPDIAGYISEAIEEVDKVYDSRICSVDEMRKLHNKREGLFEKLDKITLPRNTNNKPKYIVVDDLDEVLSNEAKEEFKRKMDEWVLRFDHKSIFPKWRENLRKMNERYVMSVDPATVGEDKTVEVFKTNPNPLFILGTLTSEDMDTFRTHWAESLKSMRPPIYPRNIMFDDSHLVENMRYFKPSYYQPSEVDKFRRDYLSHISDIHMYTAARRGDKSNTTLINNLINQTEMGEETVKVTRKQLKELHDISTCNQWRDEIKKVIRTRFNEFAESGSVSVVEIKEGYKKCSEPRQTNALKRFFPNIDFDDNAIRDIDANEYRILKDDLMDVSRALFGNNHPHALQYKIQDRAILINSSFEVHGENREDGTTLLTFKRK